MNSLRLIKMEERHVGGLSNEKILLKRTCDIIIKQQSIRNLLDILTRISSRSKESLRSKWLC